MTEEEQLSTPEAQAARLARVKLEMAMRGVPFVGEFRDKSIDYVDIAPAPFEVMIDLVETFERLTRFKADAWQVDFCGRLQEACISRPDSRTWATVHAEGQLGKSKILAQIFPAWILGHDPMHRIALATYNVTRSQSHSKAVIDTMNLPVYKEIFRDPAGWVKKGSAVSGWQTDARKASTESQFSYNPVGLQSGLTGSGAETIVIDDPYADQREAFSDTVRKNLQEFWDFTVGSRMSLHTNVFAMFHRYHVQDLAGYLLDTGNFDYWRYASICDGDYVHDETGQIFRDPLGREFGQYISPERRPPSYYTIPKQNARVWNSMFQGKPVSDAGGMFQVAKIEMLKDPLAIERRRSEGIAWARAWDNSATLDGGDWSVGLHGTMSADGHLTIFDGVLEQLDSGSRLSKQVQTAEADGHDTVILIPQDPGSAGKDVVFMTEQALSGFTVATRKTSASKEARAIPFSAAVNTGMVSMVEGDWNKRVITALRDFPLSDFDDPVDAGSDLYSHLYEICRKGLVIKNFAPQRIVAGWSAFSQRFGGVDKIPAAWTIYVGIKITPDASRPNSAVIVVRASQNTGLAEKLFVIAEYKEYTADYHKLFDWVDAALECYCDGGRTAHIWLHPDSEQYKTTIWQKLKRPVSMFDGDKVAGITETDWYLRPIETEPNPFNSVEKAAGMYWLIADETQMSAGTDEYGLCSLRQEASTWGYNDKGEPNATGAVLDCLRMICHAFRTVQAGLTRVERIEEALPVTLRAETVDAMPDGEIKDAVLTKRMMETTRIKKEIDKPIRGAHAGRFARR